MQFVNVLEDISHDEPDSDPWHSHRTDGTVVEANASIRCCRASKESSVTYRFIASFGFALSNQGSRLFGRRVRTASSCWVHRRNTYAVSSLDATRTRVCLPLLSTELLSRALCKVAKARVILR